MDLRGIEIFLAICDKGGMTAAAQHLGLTQAAVSQHLQKLERELGVALMDRNVRPARLTAPGEHLRRRGESLVSGLRSVHAELLRYRQYDIPQMRMGIIESAASAILPLLVRRLNGKVGSLSITSGTTHPLMPELMAQSFDMLISSEQIDDEESLASQVLLVEPVLLVLPGNRPAPQDWKQMGDLARDLDYIRYGERRRIGRIAAHLFERQGLEIHGSLSFDSSLALFDHVKSGVGWATSTPLCILSAGISPSDVTICSFPGANPIRSINAIWRRDRQGLEVGYVARVVRDLLRDDILPKLRERAGDAADRILVAEDDRPADTALPLSA